MIVSCSTVLHVLPHSSFQRSCIFCFTRQCCRPWGRRNESERRRNRNQSDQRRHRWRRSLKAGLQQVSQQLSGRPIIWTSNHYMVEIGFSAVQSTLSQGRTILNVMREGGRWGIFEPHDFFSLIFPLYEFFRLMHIKCFVRVTWRVFFELRACLFVREYFADWKCQIRFFAQTMMSLH